MRIGIYGGSFNPPHVAHQLACAYVLATEPLDQLWVLPTPEHAFGKDLAPWEHRVEMTRLAMRHFGDRVRVSTLEDSLPRPTRTLHTLRAIMELQPNAELALVVGSDILPETEKWLGWAEVQKLARLVVLARPGFPHPGRLELPDVSSTMVRARLADSLDVSHLLDGAVLDYARRHRLYGAVDAPRPGG